MPLAFKKIFASLVFSFILASPLCHAENINGTWSFVSLYGSTPYNYDMTFSEQGGVITGTGSGGQWTISGTISGSQVSWREDYVFSTYYADRVGTISGTTMSGTWGNQSQNGTWTATKIGDNGTSGGNERLTGIQLFCNRTGVNLETAKCSASVADQGAPPRLLPTGLVNFEATGGLFPAAASCQLQQTQFSPGIGSCEVQFTLPVSFPIGVPFPVDATYVGDSNFSPSSTSHKLIFASCVGTPQKPCSGSVALEFSDLPAILKNALRAVASCGRSVSKAKHLRAEGDPPSTGLNTLPAGSCSIETELDIDLMDQIFDLDEAQLHQLSDSISSKDASLDPILAKLKSIGNGSSAEIQKTFGNILKLSQQMQKLNEAYYKNKINGIKNSKMHLTSAATSAVLLQRASRLKVVKIPFGSNQIYVRSGSQKKITLKLNSRAKRFVAAFSKANLGSLTVKIQMSYKRKGSPKVRKLTANSLSVKLF